MRPFVVSATLLLLGTGMFAQNSPSTSQFVASRQAEVQRMAEIFYNTHLDDGTWTKHNLPECAELTHHAFVRFDGGSAKGVAASFLAVYDLDHPPARSKDQPWQGGITFVRVRPHQENRQDSGPSPDYLIVALNRALKQERAASAGRGLSTVPNAQVIANCFISISDNIPETPIATDGSASSSEVPLVPISGILIPLAGSSALARTQYVHFDKDGFLLEAGVSLTPR